MARLLCENICTLTTAIEEGYLYSLDRILCVLLDSFIDLDLLGCTLLFRLVCIARCNEFCNSAHYSNNQLYILRCAINSFGLMRDMLSLYCGIVDLDFLTVVSFQRTN